jgi:hypothetical protein
MNISEQISIMKHETRLANRTAGDGLKNWTPEARAKSLAVRRARGSVWGWDKRKRLAGVSEEGSAFDRSLQALDEDSESVRATLASHQAGIPTIGPRNAYADQLAAQRLESFKAWLAEVKRVEGAIDDFNGVVAALGGLTGGMAKAQRGQSIGPVKQDTAAEAAAKKAAVEKSIRRNFEKRNADYLRENPDDRSTMLDMVAEKAEYYSAQPARKVEMEKEVYRRIKNESEYSMRESAAPATDFKAKLDAKRSLTREREAVRAQLRDGESAMPLGHGVWIGMDEAGNKRGIVAFPKVPEKNETFTPNEDLWEAILEARLGPRRGSGLIVNRHTSACATSKGEKCNCSCGGAQHGSQSSGEPTPEPPKAEEPKADKETPPPAQEPEEAPNWEALVAGFKAVIEKNGKPTLRELKEQLAKDGDEAKYKLASAALAEAWQTYSLDKFQDQFGRDPKRNFEFRTFQKKLGVPPEFIGGK